MNFTFLAIFLGGGIGSLARHYGIMAADHLLGRNFPYGTLLVNVMGCFLMGVLMEAAALKWQMSLETRAFIFTGFLGGFTTFSTFSLDVLKLVNLQHFFAAGIYIALSVFVSLIAIFAGTHLIRSLI